MSMIKYAMAGSLKNFSKRLDKVCNQYNISKFNLYCKFIKCFFMIGSGYSDFLNYKLYLRTNEEIKKYATIKTQDKFYAIVSPAEYKDFFSIKSNFLKNFSEYIKRDSFYDGTFDELKTFLKKNKKFMYKPVNGLAGEQVKKIDYKDIKDLKKFYEEIKKNNILLEGYVIQHESVSEFAPSSVNTIRVMTFSYDGKSEILMAVMRFGNGEESVDNFHKGGMAVLVDIETGKLVGKAINKSNEEFDVHPKSKKKFDGFKIPNWDIIKTTCLNAAKVSDKIHVVGWDVAVTKDGCTFIEGNRRAGWDLPQVIYDEGKKDVMNYCLNKINKKENTNYKV